MTKAAKVEEAPASETVVSMVASIRDDFPAIVPDADGFYHDADWLRIECDWPGLKPRPGFAPLWAEIDAGLTFDDATAIPDVFNTPFGDLYRYVCPRVRAWNARARNAETGEMAPAPPPIEGGADSFRVVHPRILVWLAYTLKTIHLGGGPKGVSATT